MGNVANSSRPELVFAVVGAAGVRLNDLVAELRSALTLFGYSSEIVRLSALLPAAAVWREPTQTGEDARIRHHQAMGNAFRDAMQDGAAVAVAGLAALRQARAGRSGSPDVPANACAYVLTQLKHPREVELLRHVYGNCFYLIGGHAPRQTRMNELAKAMAAAESRSGQEEAFRPRALEVIQIDEKEEGELGQNTRDTYPLADFLVDATRSPSQISRFVELVFGHPFRTPTPDEYAMNIASAVALRSSDYNRQVGAAIVNVRRDPRDYVRNLDVVAVGMNEVPCGGGGFYWDQDSPDYRDQALLAYYSEDRARNLKVTVLAELLGRVQESEWLKDDVATNGPITLAARLLPELKGTQFMDIGEFSRPVHAEMSALIDAARRGVPVFGETMYVTTFPCHNCAKHIIAAGIQRVVYLEPYRKSRADTLHGEELLLERTDGLLKEDGKVVFSFYAGVAPRLYRPLFSMAERGAKSGISLNEWTRTRTTLRPILVSMESHYSYLAGEQQQMQRLQGDLFDQAKM
jgi:cytidine deaminase